YLSASRSDGTLQDIAGPLANLLALRIGIDDEVRFIDLLSRVDKALEDGERYGVVPFEKVVLAVNPGKDMSRTALFDVLYQYEQAGQDWKEIELNHGLGKYDFNLLVVEGETIEIFLSYNSLYFQESRISRLLGHYLELISSALREPEQLVSLLGYVTGEEKAALLATGEEVGYPKDKTITELFEFQAAAHGDRTAVVFEEKQLSYQELNGLANQLGHYLRINYQVQADDLVGICLERSEWMLVAILGILKSGGAYVPVDPAYPQERIAYMLSDSACKVVIDEAELARFRSSLADYSMENPAPVSGAEDLAYVIYTSGSTGLPKGCAVTHGSLFNYINWANAYYFKGKQDQPDFGLYTSLSFDLTVTSIFCCLTLGGKLLIYEQNRDISSILSHSFSLDSGLNSIKLTPSHINMLEYLDIGETNISCVIVGGEEVSIHHVEILKKISPSLIIYNEYGPTEATVGCIVQELELNSAVLIGKPIANTRIYILGEGSELNPVGITGEICIAGAGLARGYLHNAALTAEKFVVNPFETGKRMYRTGDLGRWLENGNIVYLGRKDNQVKIRGYRVELGEIEESLRSYPGIEGSVVTVRGTADRELVAYVVSKEELNISAIRTHLSQTLPDYMLPAYFVQLSQIPLNTNGKVNRHALPAPEGLDLDTGAAYVAAVTVTEVALVEIWQKLLGRKKVGIKDSFFDLGGHSLKAMRLLSELRREFEIRIVLKDIFEHPVLEDLGQLIDQSQGAVFTAIPQVEPQADYPLSSSQYRLWILSQFTESSIAYNMPGVFVFEGVL
ncbi:amino acid adenylation domain-containing protein, partial [Pedobacter sp. UYP1]|uniref:non-ribosomal peptide synthetase n=1 Tax=Pedobacter sp. UYP1 TaxID=1756396 RepID=UPI0033959AF9